MAFDRYPVGSSCLDVVYYDADSQILVLTFDQGQVYEYSGVPPEEVCGLLEAISKGIYFNFDLRPDGYPYSRLPDSDIGEINEPEEFSIVNEDGSQPLLLVEQETQYDYKTKGPCYSGVEWSIEAGAGGELGDSSISADGILSVGSTACGDLVVSAACTTCSQLATITVSILCTDLFIFDADGSEATDTILTASSLSFKVEGSCCGEIVWSLSAADGSSIGSSTISQAGVLYAGPDACGTLIVTVSCDSCATSQEHFVRVSDAGVLCGVSCCMEYTLWLYAIGSGTQNQWVGDKYYTMHTSTRQCVYENEIEHSWWWNATLCAAQNNYSAPDGCDKDTGPGATHWDEVPHHDCVSPHHGQDWGVKYNVIVQKWVCPAHRNANGACV